MAFTATASTTEGRAYSLGPEKVQYFTWTCTADSTTGTITCDRMTKVNRVVLSQGGIALTAATTYSTNAATLTLQNATPVTYTFSCSSGSATAGSVYADTAGNLFTTAATISSATAITMVGVKPPASATLTKTGAIAGDATLTTVAVTTAPTLYGEAIAYGI